MKLRKLFDHLPVLFVFTLSSCSTYTPKKDASIAEQMPVAPISRAVAESVSSPIIDRLPRLTSDNGELKAELIKAIKNRTKGMSKEALDAAAERFKNYIFFLGLSANDFKKAEKAAAAEASAVISEGSDKIASEESDTGGEEEDKTPSNLKAVQRLLFSSTQFLDCAEMEDWECLEKSPSFTPAADFRKERAGNTDLGAPVHAGASLDMDVYFTEAFDGSPRSGVADRFAEKISQDSERSLSVAMYGIDDIKGSMSGVYNAIIDRAQSPDTKVRAVVDVMGFEKGKSPWIFNYKSTPETADKWLFGPSIHPETPENIRMTFQYDGTPHFLHVMNDGIKDQEESRARIEWSSSRIMHNKFAVMENEAGEKSVWTGTANISKNCMGVEANANMSVYIKNDHVAQAFLDQFNLMFDFDKTIKVKSKHVVAASESDPSMVGRFHRNKYPVSKRLFTFDDGTNLRVHFAPTDDAEHRVIIPMLLSARAGDEIRIAMFGGTGFELIRAMQYAVANGANVRIAFDRRLGHGLTSWIRDSILNVNMPNPYIAKLAHTGVTPGKISVKVSSWTGKNHYKAGTLTRKNGIAEQIIVGSQNWSSSGNDFNDENLVSIQNISKGVKSAKMFNTEFDTRLWEKSITERPRIVKPTE